MVVELRDESIVWLRMLCSEATLKDLNLGLETLSPTCSLKQSPLALLKARYSVCCLLAPMLPQAED